MAYDNFQIARELVETALGNTYHGNALRVAKDIAGLSSEDRSVLDRWATGCNVAADGWGLQRIAIKIHAGVTLVAQSNTQFLLSDSDLRALLPKVNFKDGNSIKSVTMVWLTQKDVFVAMRAAIAAAFAKTDTPSVIAPSTSFNGQSVDPTDSHGN